MHGRRPSPISPRPHSALQGRGQVASSAPSAALRRERPSAGRRERGVRSVGSVPPAHLGDRSRPCARWPDPVAAILGALLAASVVTLPPGTAWQGACGRGGESPLPLGELSGCPGCWSWGTVRQRGGKAPKVQGPLTRGVQGTARGPPNRGVSLRPARGRAPPPLHQAGRATPTHPGRAARRDSPLPLGRRRAQDQLGAASVTTGSASPATAVPRAAAARSAPSERVPARSPGAGRARPGTRPRVPAPPSPAAPRPGATPDARASAPGSSPGAQFPS